MNTNPMPTPNTTPANGQDAMQEFEELLDAYDNSLAALVAGGTKPAQEDFASMRSKLRAHVRKMAEDAEFTPELADLSVFTRRLARALKKHEPESKLVKDAVEYLRCIGQLNVFRAEDDAARETPNP